MDDNPATRAGFVLGIVVAVVAIGVIALGAGGQSAPTVNELNTSSFNSDEAVATAPEESGELSMSTDGDGNTVVIDTAHGADIDREAIAPMVTTLTENGATVQYHTGYQSVGGLNASLREADAFVVFGAEQAYSEGELAGLQAFSDAGGRVLIMNEPQTRQTNTFSLFQIPTNVGGVPNPMVPLTSQYGLAYDNGYLYNMGQNDNNYRNVYATPSGGSQLTEGVDRTVFHESLAVNGGDTTLTATDGTTLSETRQSDTYGVLTRSGNVVAVGDTSIMTQEFLYRADNEVLVGNLLDFLVSGDKEPENVPEQTGYGSYGGGYGGTTTTEPTPTEPDVPDNETTPAPAP